MKYRKLGSELEVSALGLGCMPMAGIGKGMYGESNIQESLATLDRAMELARVMLMQAQSKPLFAITRLDVYDKIECQW